MGAGKASYKSELDASKVSRYVGVDISTEVIARALSKSNERISFVAEDATRFTPQNDFELIVFNECLEYFEDPLSLVRRYENFLTDNGLFIISMFRGIDTARTSRIWKRIQFCLRLCR